MEKYKNKLNKLNSNDEFVDRISAEEDKLYCYNSDIELAILTIEEISSMYIQLNMWSERAFYKNKYYY